MSPPVFILPGKPGDAGLAHGREIAQFFEPAFLDPYVESLSVINRVAPGDMGPQAARWLDSLPPHFQEEIDGMGVGAGVPAQRVAEFLYADISRPSAVNARPVDPASPRAHEPSAADLAEAPGPGPMCTGILTRIDSDLWIARNCDWLFATLIRGTAAVVHAAPGRIPTMGVGIRGDIDVDTGINAAGLWVHLHTLYVTDDPRGDKTCISWLFWAREALETCATLDELDAFMASTERDRGVIVVAGEGRTGRGAIFECARAGHERHDFDGGLLIATNHPQRKNPDQTRCGPPTGTTTSRYCAARDYLSASPPSNPPGDLMNVLAADGVEMRTPRHLRTIYSAVVSPTRGDLWFASGDAKGAPAPSRNSWSRVPLTALM